MYSITLLSSSKLLCSSSCLLFVCLCFIFVSRSSAQACGPAPQAGYNYDFTAFGEKSATGADNLRYAVSPCQAASACQGSYTSSNCLNDPQQSWYWYSIGLLATRQWSYINNDPAQGAQLAATGENYYATCGSMLMKSTTSFKCVSSPGDDSVVINQLGSAATGCQWIFTVNSKVACNQNPSGPTGGGNTGSNGGDSGGTSDTSGGGGLSGGWIFVIILIVVTFVYCVGGGLFMKYQKGAEGLSLIPNVGFWREIPSLVKDGCLYSWAKIKHCAGRGGGSTGGGGYTTY